MFASSVAPAGEKSHKESELDVTKLSVDKIQNPECSVQNSQFLKTMKYPVILMNLGGIYVPSFCVCEKKLDYNDRVKSKSRDVGDSDSNEDNGKSFMYVHCVKGNCLGNGVSRKRCPDDDAPWWAITKKVACIVMIICHSINTIRYCFILKDTSRDLETLVFPSTNFLILTSYFYLLTTNSHACFNNFTPFLCSVRKYEQKYGFKREFKKCSRNIFILFCFVIVLQFVQGTILIFGIVTYSGGLSSQLWPLTSVNGVLRFFGAIFVGVGIFFAGCNLYGAHFLRGAVTSMLQGEFQRTAFDMTSVLLNAGDNSCVEFLFNQVLEKFKVVCDLMDKSNGVIKHTIAASYIFCIPTLCLVLFGLIKGIIHLGQFLVLSVNVIAAVAILVHTTWTLATLRSQIRSVCSAVFQVEWYNLPPPLLQKVLLFTHMSSARQHGMSVYGMFQADWSTLLVVGAILIVYAAATLQSELGTPTHVCDVTNSTL